MENSTASFFFISTSRDSGGSFSPPPGNEIWYWLRTKSPEYPPSKICPNFYDQELKYRPDGDPDTIFSKAAKFFYYGKTLVKQNRIDSVRFPATRAGPPRISFQGFTNAGCRRSSQTALAFEIFPGPANDHPGIRISDARLSHSCANSLDFPRRTSLDLRDGFCPPLLLAPLRREWGPRHTMFACRGESRRICLSASHHS